MGYSGTGISWCGLDLILHVSNFMVGNMWCYNTCIMPEIRCSVV
mgnify:CR=1 FL=1